MLLGISLISLQPAGEGLCTREHSVGAGGRRRRTAAGKRRRPEAAPYLPDARVVWQFP